MECEPTEIECHSQSFTQDNMTVLIAFRLVALRRNEFMIYTKKYPQWILLLQQLTFFLVIFGTSLSVVKIWFSSSRWMETVFYSQFIQAIFQFCA